MKFRYKFAGDMSLKKMVALQFYVYRIFIVSASFYFLWGNCNPLQGTDLHGSNYSDVTSGGNGSEVPYSDDCSMNSTDTDAGPLFLTPYIEKGCLDHARRLSKVKGVPGMARDSFSGFLTVRQNDDANLFFWFFPSQNNARIAPVILWLNGGPGTSSLSGLFAENGPYYVTENFTLKPRDNNWATNFNMIYLDNPVGAGFSFAKSMEAYPNSSVAVAHDIYKALVMFFQVFSDYSSNEFFIAGQSYGAKFAVHLADIIDSVNQTIDSDKVIHLKGIICLAGFLDPLNQVSRADYWYQVGLLDPKDYSEALNREKQILTNSRNGNSSAAPILKGSYISFLFQSAGFKTGESVLESELPPVFENYPTFVNRSDVRIAIHVANQAFAAISRNVSDALSSDYSKEVTSDLERILNKGFKVLLMSGNLDVYLVPAVYYKMIWSLQWRHAEAFAKSNRTVWRIDDHDREFAGYVNCAMNLCFSLVRNGGHRLTSDQTRSTADLVRRFIDDLLPVTSMSP